MQRVADIKSDGCGVVIEAADFPVFTVNIYRYSRFPE
jgi:hypothetical protein